MTWLMTCPVIGCPLSCQRYQHQPTLTSNRLLDLLLNRQADWVSPTVQRYFHQGAALKSFNSFCQRFSVHTPFPVSEHLPCCFASFLADQGLAPQTGKAYLSAVRSMQISLGLPDPREQSSLPILKRVQAGISRARLAGGTPPKITSQPMYWRESEQASVTHLTLTKYRFGPLPAWRFSVSSDSESCCLTLQKRSTLMQV